MGSSQATQQQKDNNIDQNNKKAKSLYQEQEGVACLVAEKAERIQELNELIDGVEKREKAISIDVIFKILDALNERPDFTVLSETIAQLQGVMTEMATVIESVETKLDDTRIDTIHSILEDFGKLLKNTKRIMGKKRTKVDMQEKTIKQFIHDINNLEIIKYGGDELKDIFNAFAEFVDPETDEIQAILTQWTKFYKRCQEEHRVWKNLVCKYENESQGYKKFKKIFKILGSMVIFTGATVVVLALPCVAPFVLAGVKIGISCGVAAHASGGSVLLIGGILEGMGFQMKKDTLKELDEIIKQTKQIRGTLKVILHFSSKIENKLEDVNNIQNEQLNQWIEQLKNARSRNYVLMYARNIDKELIEYEKQCKQIVETVQNAQDGFVNVWKNLAL